MDLGLRDKRAAVAAATAGLGFGELGDPADFGAAAAFLCSTQARFVTGTSLLVDGGASRGLL
ncbi:MAG: SDR family oxidoreductase [Aquihabitans sp.]